MILSFPTLCGPTTKKPLSFLFVFPKYNIKQNFKIQTTPLLTSTIKSNSNWRAFIKCMFECRDKELSRNRTISEPVGEGGKGGHVTPEPGTTPRPRSVRYSPGILSPTSPVGSVSAGKV